MSKLIVSLSLVAALAATAPAWAKSPHAKHQRQPVYSAPAGKIDSGYYPPRTWDEIEISGPNSY